MKELFLIVFVSVMVLFGLIYSLGTLACNEVSSINPSYEFRYEFWNGCLIKYNGLWMPYKNVRGNE